MMYKAFRIEDLSSNIFLVKITSNYSLPIAIYKKDGRNKAY